MQCSHRSGNSNTLRTKEPALYLKIDFPANFSLLLFGLFAISFFLQLLFLSTVFLCIFLQALPPGLILIIRIACWSERFCFCTIENIPIVNSITNLRFSCSCDKVWVIHIETVAFLLLWHWTSKDILLLSLLQYF